MESLFGMSEKHSIIVHVVVTIATYLFRLFLVVK